MKQPKVTCELRKNDDGSLDEALLYVNGVCVFHLEQLNESEWYMELLHGKLEQRAYKSALTGERGRLPAYKDETRLEITPRNGKSWVDVIHREDL